MATYKTTYVTKSGKKISATTTDPKLVGKTTGFVGTNAAGKPMVAFQSTPVPTSPKVPKVETPKPEETIFNEPKQPESMTEAVDQSYSLQQEAKNLVEAGWQKEKKNIIEYADKYGIKISDMLRTSATQSDYLKAKALESQENVQFQQAQADIAKQLEESQFAQTSKAGASAVAGMTTSMAQSREGAISSGKPLAAKEFGEYTTKVLTDTRKRLDMAQASRENALQQLKKAEQSGNETMITSLNAQIAGAEQTIRQEQTALMNAENQATTTAANVAKVKQETIQNTFESMGEFAGQLDTSALLSMADQAGLTFGEVSAMKEMAVLTAKLGKAKTQVEVEQTQAQIDKLKAELPLIGKPAAVQEQEWYLNLPKEKQAEALLYKSAGYNFMQVENPDGTKSVIRTNPDGTATLAYTAEDFANGQGVTLQDIGNGKVSGYDYGDTSKIKTDNQKLANGEVGTPGIDIGGRVGSAIPSTVSGTVTFVGNNGGYGNQVVVTTSTGDTHYFSHLNSMNVKEGQEVQAGDLIGGMGNTGNSTGPHLDYRVKQNGEWVDPKQFFGTGKSIPGLQDIISNAKQLVGTVAGQKEVEQSIKDYARTGDVKALQNYIKNLAAGDLDAEGKKTWRVRSNIVAQGDKLKTKMDEFERNGGDLGIFSGSVNSVMNKVGKLDDPKLQAIAQDMRMILEDFARAQTGAAIQDFEREEFGKILPTIFDGKELAASKIDAFSNYWQTTMDNTIREKIGDTAYESLYGEQAEAPAIDFDSLWTEAATAPTQEDDSTWETL